MGDNDTIHPRDRISKLPDFIVHHIMSFLSAKEVAQTSILSKRWNYLRISFPILDFLESYPYFVGRHLATFNPSLLSRRQEKKFRRRIYNFMEFVDDSLRRFCKLKLSMQKFRLLIGLVNVGYYFPFLDEWIEFVVHNEVKELDFDVQTDIETVYTLPRLLFSAKWVTTLKLSGCKLKLPSDTLKLHSLRSLALVEVHVNREMIQKLASECLLLEELSMVDCYDMKCIYISKAFKLKIININVSPYIFESIEINVPSLQQLKLGSTTLRGPIVIDGCLNLNMLQLSGLTLNDQEFHRIFSKLPLLENLNVLCCPCLESVTISSDQLEKLSVELCFNLKAIDVHTPNLLYFSFVNNPIPVSSMNAPRLRKVELGKIDPNTRWYLDVKEFLVGVSNQIEELTLCFMSEWMSFNVEEFRKRSTLVPCEVGNLCLRKIEPPSSLASFLDGIFWICYPGTLSMEALNENDNLFIQLLYEEMLNRDVSCCHSHHIKYWRHYLKDFKIDNFVTFEDKKLLSRDDLMEVWPQIPTGTIRFHLEWCFSVPLLNV